jgi:aminodeoxyfutalosine deaminase
MRILSADYVLPISSDPVANGAVVIDGAKIVAVGKRDEMAANYANAEHEDFGQAAILPGFVNCHSHLEITAMRGALDEVEHDFSAWLLKLNELRAGMTERDIEAAATSGATEGARAGVTCFGDIGRFGQAGLNALKTVGLRGVLFQETEFSADERTADTDFEKLKEKFFYLREQQTGLVEVGVSPHSPYTVSGKLFEKIGRFALDEKIKISIHAAESSGEDDLLRCGTGFFTEVYKKFGVEWASPLCTPIEFLSSTGVLDTGPLLAHCVQASDSDIAIIASSGASIAHCPKSNAKFGHGSAPLEKFFDARIPVGLGSDSVASNNICDLLEESRYAALAARNRNGRRRFISASEILRAATLGGAQALGLDQKIGTLEVGKEADIAVVSLSEISHQPVSDVYAAMVFSACGRDTVLTLVAGREVFRRGV